MGLLAPPEELVETYKLWFQEGLPAGEEPNLTRSLEAAGQKASDVLARAQRPEMEAALAEATDEARQAGIFGSPSFVVDGELFWGDDRLDDAVQWARRAR